MTSTAVCADFEKTRSKTLALQSRGMEFALEMVIKSQMHGLRITEVRLRFHPMAATGRRTCGAIATDGEVLRFYLLMSPRWFFGYPGAILFMGGLIASTILFRGPLTISSVTFDYHTLLYSAAAILLGYQSLLLFAFAKLMAVETGLHPPQTKFWFLEQRPILERCAHWWGSCSSFYRIVPRTCCSARMVGGRVRTVATFLYHPGGDWLGSFPLARRPDYL